MQCQIRLQKTTGFVFFFVFFSVLCCMMIADTTHTVLLLPPRGSRIQSKTSMQANKVRGKTYVSASSFTSATVSALCCHAKGSRNAMPVVVAKHTVTEYKSEPLTTTSKVIISLIIHLKN